MRRFAHPELRNVLICNALCSTGVSASSGKTLHFPDDMHKLTESSGISVVFPDEMRETAFSSGISAVFPDELLQRQIGIGILSRP